MIWAILGTLIFALSGALVYIYYLYHGQFEDLEEVKYQLFHEEE